MLRTIYPLAVYVLIGGSSGLACSSKGDESGNASGGRTGAGGFTATGGSTLSAGGSNQTGGSGGSANLGGALLTTGGAPTLGGATASGGKNSGGSNSGGASSGGTGSGGVNSGGTGVGNGGSASAGEAGKAASGGASNAGSGGGTAFNPAFILGADISSVQESNSTFRDTDGKTKTIFELLKNHGFNYIRLKTFVDPAAPYGYASKANGCPGLSEPFGDRDHVVAYGKQAKAAGMGFLLDFHYSDVWADPGNQIIPEKWRAAASIPELAALVKAYTKDVLTTAVAAGARPDMVQVGNEITPGMLMHVPGSNTDCYGNNPQAAPLGGSTSNWANLATLLSAGIAAVREVDPKIKILLHVENTDDLSGVKRWVDSARMRNVDFDVLGLSCYVEFQGQPSVWKNTFEDLAKSYPDLEFAIAEYNPERTQANRIMKALPNGRGLGTFFWEPTRSGEWGPSLFTWQGNTATANAADFAEYDTLRGELGL